MMDTIRFDIHLSMSNYYPLLQSPFSLCLCPFAPFPLSPLSPFPLPFSIPKKLYYVPFFSSEFMHLAPGLVWQHLFLGFSVFCMKKHFPATVP